MKSWLSWLLIDTVSSPWLTDVTPRGRLLSGRAARGLGRSQKDGLPFPPREAALAVQGHRLALEGQPIAAPLLTAAAGTLKILACVCLHLSSPAFPHPLIDRRPALTRSTR